MLVFFGTSRYSAQFLDLTIKNGLKINLVVSAPPKPTGRQQILTENPTVATAKKFKIPFLTSIFFTPSKVEGELQGPASTFHRLSSTPTIGLMLDFNRIIPKNIIDIFNKGIINIHFSKLPQYRGPAPVQYTILNGDRQAWISYFLISEKVDEGRILSQTSLPLDQTETSQSLYEKLVQKAVEEIPQVINDYLTDRVITDRVRPCQQQGTPSYTHKLTSETTKIDWSKSSIEIDRLIRASSPEPGAWTMVETQRSKGTKKQRMENSIKLCNSETLRLRLKILKAHLENEKLILDEVQLEGKNPVTWQQFQQGYPNVNLTFEV